MKDETEIILYSSDKNNAMWDIVIYFFKKYWPDCPYPKVLLTDTDKQRKGIEIGFDKVIECDSEWATMMKTAIQETQASYFITWMDDYLICEPVNTAIFEKAIAYLKEQDAFNVRLTPARFQKGIDMENGYVKIEMGHAYALSTHIGIWSSDKFLSTVNDKWTAWEFERVGSLTIDREYKVFCSKDLQLNYIEAVRKGKFFPEGAALIEENGFNIKDTGKTIMTSKEYGLINIKAAILSISPDFVQKLQNNWFSIIQKHR